MTDWAGKLVGTVARVAALLHMAEFAGEHAPLGILVRAETINRAITIGR